MTINTSSMYHMYMQILLKVKSFYFLTWIHGVFLAIDQAFIEKTKKQKTFLLYIKQITKKT